MAAEVEDKCSVSETGSVKSLGASNPPDLVSHVPASLPPSSPEDKDIDVGEKENDSLADLDIVAVGSGDGLESPPDNMTVPDNLDESGLASPPDMSASPEPGTVSPVISLPDAPSSEPGSPDLKVSSNSCRIVANTNKGTHGNCRPRRVPRSLFRLLRVSRVTR